MRRLVTPDEISSNARSVSAYVASVCAESCTICAGSVYRRRAFYRHVLYRPRLRIDRRTRQDLGFYTLRRKVAHPLHGWSLCIGGHRHALRERVPLVLVPRPQLRRLNAQLEFLGEAAEIVVHPTTPPAAGVCDDQRLIVRSALGELTGVAHVDASVRRGAVSVPHGHAGANVNLLTRKDDIDLVHRDDALLRRAGQPAPGVTLLRGASSG